MAHVYVYHSLLGRACAWVLAALFFARTADGQLRGRVLSDEGSPIASAIVEVWNGKLRMTKTLSDSKGKFVVEDHMLRQALRLSVRVRAIGYRPVEIMTDQTGRELVVALQRIPSQLASVEVLGRVGGKRDPCRVRPSDAAMSTYRRAAQFYRADTRWLDRAARYSHVRRLTGVADREAFHDIEVGRGWTRITGVYEGQRASNASAVPRRFSESDRELLRFPAPERTMDGWLYPHFWEWASVSFVSRSFVDSMPKAVINVSSGGFLLAFCPAVRRGAYVSGEIELAPDTTIVAVRWRFHVGDAGKEAGGVAIFGTPANRREREHLLPRRSIAWERVPGTPRFETTEYAFGKWIVAERGHAITEIPDG